MLVLFIIQGFHPEVTLKFTPIFHQSRNSKIKSERFLSPIAARDQKHRNRAIKRIHFQSPETSSWIWQIHLRLFGCCHSFDFSICIHHWTCQKKKKIRPLLHRKETFLQIHIEVNLIGQRIICLDLISRLTSSEMAWARGEGSKQKMYSHSSWILLFFSP